jgi:hypothetical protein
VLPLKRYCSKEALRETLRSGDHIVEKFADQTIERMELVEDEINAEFILLSLRSLGLRGCFSAMHVLDAAVGHGLPLCPAQAGPDFWRNSLQLLRLGNDGEVIRIGMLPVTTDARNGICSIFEIGRKDIQDKNSGQRPLPNKPVLHLNAHAAGSNLSFQDTTRWLFRAR